MSVLAEYELIAEELMELFGLEDWDFKYINDRRRLGYCDPRRKIIALSKHLVKHGTAGDIEDTIRHEIAHALDYLDRGKSDHSTKWKKWARYCGANPVARADVDLPLEYHKAFDYCPNCGQIVKKLRRSNRGCLSSCGVCAASFNGHYCFIRNIPLNTMKGILSGKINPYDTEESLETYEQVLQRFGEEYAKQTPFYKNRTMKRTKFPNR